MPFKPNSPQGAKYPSCKDCGDENVALYIAEPIELSDKNMVAMKRLPKNATREQAEAALIPGLLCADCAAEKKIKLIGELPWPPVVG